MGAGAFGVVYEAFDRQEASLVALKVLRFGEADALYRFKKGFRALADIRHPNLVSFYELLSEEGLWFFSMELVPGVDFIEALNGPREGDERLSDTEVYARTTKARILPHPSSNVVPVLPKQDLSFTPPDFGRVRSLVLQLARGLHTVHESGRVHRDIKPPNVLVTDDDRAVLLDFGLVTELQSLGLPQAEPQTVGTPAYMSPEQALALPGTPASDWYSVGVMLYQALSGRLPFMGTALEIMAGKQTEKPAELAAVPEDLSELCFGLLDPDPETRVGGDELIHRLDGSAQSFSLGAVHEEATSFVGRQEILTELEDALAASRRSTVTVDLQGSSGMGKTALLERFVARLDAGTAEEETIVLHGRCYLQESVPYKALDSLIDSLSRYLASLPESDVVALLPEDMAPLSRLFPVLLRVGPVAALESAPLDPQKLRRRAIAGLRELLVRLAEQRRVVLIIDDLQWGDIDSFLLLNEILKPPEPPRILLIGAYRSEDASSSPFLRALREHREALAWRGVDVREIELGALSSDEAQELITALSQPTGAMPQRRTAAILQEAEGNPLFLSELARLSQHEDEESETPSPPSTGSLNDLIRRRVDLLTAEARRLLELVAVAGQPIELEIARQAARCESGSAEALAQLRARKLIRQSTKRGRDEIETYHDRIRLAVTERASEGQLRRLHADLAQALESTGQADPEMLAFHFRATEQTARASRYAATAAAQAEQALAFDRAARLFRLALDLLEGSSAERYRLEVQLGEALANAGRSREAAETFLQAAGHSGTIDPSEAQRHAAEKLLISGHIERGTAILRHVLRTLDMHLPKRSWKALLDLWWHRLRLRWRGLRFDESSAADLEPEALRRIDVCWSVEIGLCLVDVLRASQFHARHLLLALEAGEPQRIARGLAMEIFFGSMDGGVDRQVAAQARQLASRVPGRYPAGLTDLALGMQDCSKGAWETARQHLERAENQLREARTGVAWELDTVRHFRVLSLLHLGRWPELFAELPQLIEPAREQGDLYLEIHLRHWVESLQLLTEDQPVAARHLLGDEIRDWSQKGFHFQHFGHLHGRVQTEIYDDQGSRAWELVNRRWNDLTGSMIQRIEMVLILSWDLRARAALAAAATQPSGTALRSWLLAQADTGANNIERAGSSWAIALAGAVRAGAATLRGQLEIARRQLEVSALAFDECGMTLHALVIRRRSRQLDGDSVEPCDRQLGELGIRRPKRIARVLTPGDWPEDA